MFIIEVGHGFALGTVFSTFEKAQEAADKLRLNAYEIKEEPSALKEMVRKLDTRNKRTSRGYITNRDELTAILSEVSKHVSVSIVEEERPYHVANKEITVKIQLSLTLERDLL